MTRAADIEEQAAAWLTHEDSERWTDVDKAARDSWLAQSVVHRVAYLRLQSVWKRSERLAVLQSAPIPQARTHVSWQSWQSIAAGFAVLAVMGATGAYWYSHPREVYRTPIGVHETIHLADGTSVELNTNTQLRTAVTPKRREVVLEQGEAYFQVVHNSARPFVVLAGSERITDLGTKFLVRRDGNHVHVIVTQGRVKVEDLDHPQTPPAILSLPNMQVVASNTGTLVVIRTPQQVQRALSWRTGFLEFNQETLEAAAAEFNRYNEKQLVLEGDSVAKTRIGGSFKATNVEAFARLLRDGFGFSIRETDREVRVSE